MQTNILGSNLEVCCSKPVTGYYRDGVCRTSEEDTGTHTVCAIVTTAFLEYSKSKGNDLMTPAPHFDFPGLKEGDKWCLCALRWKEAYEAGCAPKIIAEATSNLTTRFVEKEILLQYKV